MNWLSIQFWYSMLSVTHSFSPQRANAVPSSEADASGPREPSTKALWAMAS